MADDIEKSLRRLTREGAALEARSNLSRSEKEALIAAVGGPRTARSVRQAMLTFAKERIPFLFSSLDPQSVADLMANDVDALIEEAIARTMRGGKKL